MMLFRDIHSFNTRMEVVPSRGSLHVRIHGGSEFSSMTMFFDEEKTFNSFSYDYSNTLTNQTYHLSFSRLSKKGELCNFSDGEKNCDQDFVIEDDKHFNTFYDIANLITNLYQIAASNPEYKPKIQKQVSSMLDTFKALCDEMAKALIGDDKQASQAIIVQCANRFPQLMVTHINTFLKEVLSSEAKAVAVETITPRRAP